jgi:hypothetical protein
MKPASGSTINLTKDFLAERRVVIADPQSKRRTQENAASRLRLPTSTEASARRGQKSGLIVNLQKHSKIHVQKA